MSGKYALIIGNSEYTDAGLAQLTAPGKDAEDFARVLKDKEIGAFDNVKVIVNELSASVIEAIDEFFDQKKPDDMLVLYFSGHGIRDESGSLYLAFMNTIRSRLRSTAIKSDYIREAMDQSRSKRQVLILDCCNSGAFPQGTKAELGGAMGMTKAFQGYGRFVLTASDATQFAWEGDKVIGETDNSLFTHFLVKGLEGEADNDGDGRITVDELYDYAFDQISRVTPKQTPTKSSSKVEGEIVLRQSMRIEDMKPVALPAPLLDSIQNPFPDIRLGAVQQLIKLLNGKNLALAHSASEALERISQEDDSRTVSRAALQALEVIRQAEQKTEEEQKAREEAEHLAALKAESERKAKEDAEQLLAEQKAKEEAKRIESLRAEEERVATQKAEGERIAKARLEAERLAAQNSEEERIAKAQAERIAIQKAEAEHKAKVKATPIEALPVEMRAETVSAVPQKRPTFRAPVIGGIAVAAMVVFVLAGFVINALLNNATPTATEPPLVSNPATEAPAFELPATEAAVTEVLVTTTRKGGWLDQINFSVVSSDLAITQLQAGTIDIYGTSLSPSNYPAINDAGLNYSPSYSLYYDILYNPAVFKGNSTLNPYSNRKIREATNWLYDRAYINREIYANASLPKFFAITTNGPEYNELADAVHSLEAKYTYDPDKARQVISDEMITLGAELGEDRKWQYKGKPVTLIFIIRDDSDGTRKSLGDYIADQLEGIGFTVDRQYKKSADAFGILFDSEPTDGQWSMYTAAWSNFNLQRDEKGIFQAMYLPLSIQGDRAFKANSPDSIFEQIGNDLANNNFTTLAQRRQMMSQALELSLQDSLQVWLIDGQNYTPYDKNVQVASGLGSGLEGTQAWPFTIRLVDGEGGTLNWAASDLFSDPWNPVAGSNWTWDQGAIYATQSGGLMTDPTNGLAWPLRIEKAEVTVKTGLAVQSSLDWVTLKATSSIDVPSDAWVDWNPGTQTFITAGSGKTARVKSVVYYPSDLFQTVKWHDGSYLSVGDFVMSMIMIFDPGKPESAIYDGFGLFAETLTGIKIVSTDPLIIEYYTDALNLDAELNVYSMWPMYGYGHYGFGKIEAGWHVIAVANMAESNGELAYSVDKANSTQREWMNLLGGASLESLSVHLNNAAQENLIPYSPTMSQFVTAEEASIRYSNLKAWYAAHNHFWIGTGPYYLDRVSITDKTLILKHYDDYPDLSDRWSFLIK